MGTAPSTAAPVFENEDLEKKRKKVAILMKNKMMMEQLMASKEMYNQMQEKIPSKGTTRRNDLQNFVKEKKLETKTDFLEVKDKTDIQRHDRIASADMKRPRYAQKDMASIVFQRIII